MSFSSVSDDLSSFLLGNLCKRLGVFSGCTAKPGETALDYRALMLGNITLNTQAAEVLRAFEQAMGKIDGIIECMLVSGVHDYQLTILCRDLDDYERIHRQSVGNLPGVTNIIAASSYP